MYEWPDYLFFAFIGLCGAGLVGICGWAALDTVQERRAFTAIAACQTQRGVPLRKSLSTLVVCVPANSRQDTTTINVR